MHPSLLLQQLGPLVVCLTLALGLLFGASSARADRIAADAFGMHLHGLMWGAAWPSVPIGYLRLWDAGVLWRHLEPQPGQWNFAVLDRYVQEAEVHRVKVLMTLGQPPQWAAARPGAKSNYGPGASSEPRSMSDWRRYVETLARRYKGRIQAWEIWNEANVPHAYSGDVRALAELERIAAEALKAADPANLVLTASIQGGAFRELDAYFAAGGGRHSDAVSYHFYALSATPEVLPERIRKVREIMARHGLGDKPLWNTEVGWLIPNGDGGYKGAKASWLKWTRPGGIDAAGYVARSVLLSLNGGIRHVFWYAWDNGAMGLAEDKGSRPKPAAHAYARIQEWLVGADFRGCREGDGYWSCSLFRDGKEQWITWSAEPRRITLPGEWRVNRLQALLEDRPVAISGRQIVLGPLPVLLSP